MIDIIESLFSFEGRVNREKLYISLLSYMVLNAIFSWAFNDLDVSLVVVIIVTGALQISYLSFFVRRLHDIGRSGWGLWIPFYNAYIGILALFTRGDEGPNKYGEDPLQVVSV